MIENKVIGKTLMKSKTVNTLLAGVLWLVLWQAAAAIIDKNIILVSPVNVAKRLGSLLFEPTFLKSVVGSTQKIISGYLLGLSVGSLFAALAARFKPVRYILAPLCVTVKAIPVASFTILALFLIPAKNLSVLVTFLISVPIVYSNLLAGIDNIDRELVEMATLFKINPVRRAVYICFSQVLPYFRTAASVSAGLSWKSGVAAELIVIVPGSIGERLYQSKVEIESADLFAWTFVVIVLSFLTEFIFCKLIDLSWKAIERV